jgi:hypothetical protein
MVALLIGAMMSVTVIRGIVITETLNQANEQAVVAFGMCKAKMEDAMGRHFEDVVASNFPRERDIPLTHLGGTVHIPIECTRWTSIAEQSDPTRKIIRTHVQWEYRGKRFRSSVTGVKYPK